MHYLNGIYIRLGEWFDVYYITYGAGNQLVFSEVATEAVGVTEDGSHLHFEVTSGFYFRTAYTKGKIVGV